MTGEPAPQVESAEAGRPILVVGYDQTLASDAALGIATDLADRLGAALHIVHAIDLGDYPLDPDSPSWEADVQQTLTRCRDHVATVLGGWEGPWTYQAEHGHPVHLLTAVADERDALMVVIGSHGEGLGPGLQRLLGGTSSVTHGLIGNHHRPVLVVPQPQPTREPHHHRHAGTS